MRGPWGSRGAAEKSLAVAGVAGALAVAVGATGLLGWAAGEPRLTAIALEFRPIVPNTALAIALAGAALLLLARARAPGRVRSAGRALAVASAAIGVIEIYESLEARSILVDRSFDAPPPTLITALGITGVGAALGLLDVGGRPRGTPPSHYLALACLMAALVVTAGYIYREPLLYELPVGSFRESGMALLTALGLALLCIGLLCARPDAGLMAIVTSPYLGGAVSRRFLLALLAAPAVGLVAMAGEMAHFWEQEVAEALVAVAGLAVAALLILTTARSVNHLDATRRRAHEEVLQWKEFFDRAAWGAVLVSADGRILTANAAYAKMHGYELAELEALPVASLTSELQRAELPDLFARAAERGHLSFECERVRKDGTTFPAVIDATAVRRADGTVSHYVAYMQEISERRAAEQAQARLAAIVETSEDAILSSDTNAVLLSANAAAARLFGYSNDELVGHSATMFLPPERSSEIEGILDRMRRGEHVVGFDTVRIRKDGTTFPASVTISPIRDRSGRITMISSVVRDVTELKELEHQREEWATFVAHDLRQPLGAIALHSQIVLRVLGRTDAPLPPSVAESVQHIVASTRRLDRMVDDLTDVSRIEANRLRVDLREADLDPVVSELVARTAPMTAGRPVGVKTRGTPRRIHIDPARIEQVLSNLITNALKYGDPETEIAIEVEWTGGSVEIAVTNRGPGIPRDQLGRIFERFARTARARASGVPGLGVGLYICRGLVEAHGGRIWVESTPNETTTVHVELPAPEVTAVQSAPLLSSSPMSGGP